MKEALILQVMENGKYCLHIRYVFWSNDPMAVLVLVGDISNIFVIACQLFHIAPIFVVGYKQIWIWFVICMARDLILGGHFFEVNKCSLPLQRQAI